jgi:6-phosphogluconolactonase
VSPPPEVVVASSARELADRTAARLVAALATALDSRAEAHWGLTGGGILESVFRAVKPLKDSVDWSRVHVWWGDERYVASDSDDRNDTAAFAALLDALPLAPERVHRMPAADPGSPDVDVAAAAYAAELRAAIGPDDAAGGTGVPRFDVMLLGVGPDGHCASLFPGRPGVHENRATVIGVRDSPKPPPLRLSLTFPALDAAAEIWFVASGQAKAHAVAMAISGADPAEVPSAGPRGRERTLWLIDRDAALELPAAGQHAGRNSRA